MEIKGKRVLLLGGYGLVGSAVCRALMPHEPGEIVISSLRRDQAELAVEDMRREFTEAGTKFLPAWGDILLRADWQGRPAERHPRTKVLEDTEQRRRLVADILEELDEEILSSSLLYQQILGKSAGLKDRPADLVIDCVNTATAVAYQNVFQTAQDLEGRIRAGIEADWPEEIERLLTALYVPQLVRHMQILFESMVAAGTEGYVKVGTSGTGGMGFNIPYTHGEERPSRVLLSKSAVAGAQSMLIFLMARTPGGPRVVKEIKPTAAIAWKEISYGPIRSGGRDFPLYDCPPDAAYPLSEDSTRAPEGDFGEKVPGRLESVYIDTGENGLFAAGEFAALTSLGQMEFVTPEEIAQNVVSEILGGSTGKDIVNALDGAVMGPSYRAGFMRDAALNRLSQLEEENQVESIAFEMLGPPRLSKLLFEAHLIKLAFGNIQSALEADAGAMASALYSIVKSDAETRQQILSIGIPILEPTGDGLLRGPSIKSDSPEHGWVDLRPQNMVRWQERLRELAQMLETKLDGDTSSKFDRNYPALRNWRPESEISVGELVGWLFSTEEEGRRAKS
ncbi:MAG: short-chain dehydrogenase [Anaerolineales bacterium]